MTRPEPLRNDYVLDVEAQLVTQSDKLTAINANTNISATQTPPTTTSTMCPPTNFGQVADGIYRCSFPQAADYEYIKKLQLATIITLGIKDVPDEYRAFMGREGINHYNAPILGTKKEAIPVDKMEDVLRIVLDKQNHPVLVHCNKGKHRTGCVIAAIRKVTGWKLPLVLEEYKSYAKPKVRDCDIDYITAFDPSDVPRVFCGYDLQSRTPQMLVAQSAVQRAFFSIIAFFLCIYSGSRIVAPTLRSSS